MEEAIPRLLTLIFCGASLSVAGAVTQSLFQNPFASPGTLGISSGSSLCVLLAFACGLHLSYPFLLPFAAIIGSLASFSFVYFLSLKNNFPHNHHLILAGIAISTVLFSTQQTLLYALRENWSLMQTLTEWESGSTFDLSWQHFHMAFPLSFVGLFICLYLRQEINILSMGLEDAENLGCDVKKTQLTLFFSVAFLTGSSCASIGNLPFFSFILPHITRKITGPNNRILLPICAINGACCLTGMDLFLRFFQITSFSIGHLSSLFGGSFFLYLLCKDRRHA